MEFTPLFFKHAKAKTRIVISCGGTSSSKTWSIMQLLYLKALKYDGLHISIVAESLPVLKRGIIRDFILMLQTENVYNEKFHNKTDNIYNVGKSKIEFFSADDPSKIRGSRRDVVWLNECNNISYDVYTELAVRTKHQIFLDYNPTQLSWVNEKILLLPKTEYTFIHSTYKDNDKLHQNIVKAIELKQSDKEWFKVYGLGEIGSSEGTIFNNWSMCDVMPNDYQWCLFGIDWGFTNDPSTCLRVCLSQGELWCDEILYERGLTNSDIITRLQHLKPGEFIGDSAEPKSIEDLRRAGFNIIGAAKGPDSIRNGIDSIKKYKLNITKTSVNLIKELRNYQWKRTNNGDYDSKPIDDWNHCFVGDTNITTIKGLIPIKDIKEGDQVLTSNGYKKVLAVFNNGMKQTSEYSIYNGTDTIRIICTSNHKIKTDTEWTQISLLQPGQMVYLNKPSMEMNILSMQEPDIFQEEDAECTEMYGNSSMEKFLKDLTYIISTIIPGIIKKKISSVFHPTFTVPNTEKNDSKIPISKSNSIHLELKLQNFGTNLTKEDLGTKSNPNKDGRIDHISISRVRNAEISSNQNLPQLQNIVTSIVKCVHIIEKKEMEVFDIMVEDQHEYFANGILVHNCIDPLRYICLSRESKGLSKVQSFNLDY